MALIEAHHQYRIRHQNVIQLMAIMIDKSELWLISELVIGVNMEQLLYDETARSQFGMSHLTYLKNCL